MIYKKHEKEWIHINKEDYKDRPHAFTPDCIWAETQNMSFSGDWMDEETGKVLFTHHSVFEPGPYYYEDGDGKNVDYYTAHFPLREGETAVEAFTERKAFDEAREKRQALIKQMPESVQNGLKNQIEEAKRISNEALALKIEMLKRDETEALLYEIKRFEEKVIEDDLMKQRIREAAIKRKQDPKWQKTCETAKLLLKSNLKDQAKMLIKGYLVQHTR